MWTFSAWATAISSASVTVTLTWPNWDLPGAGASNRSTTSVSVPRTSFSSKVNFADIEARAWQ
jgi:hypothetical protein